MRLFLWLFTATRRIQRSAVSRSGYFGSAGSSRFSYSLVLLLGGCTIFYEPSFEPSDGGPEAGPEAGPESGLDGGPDVVRTEIDCTDREDNDNDGLIDCNDYDCSYLEACCDSNTGSVEIDETWTSGLANWSQFGTSIPRIDEASNTVRFAGDAALLWKSCSLAELGLFGEASFIPELHPDGPGGCERDYVEIGFTVASGTNQEVRFSADIKLRVNACGRYDVYRGTTLLTPSGYSPANASQVVKFQLAPGTTANDEVLRATIAVGQGPDAKLLVEGVAFMNRDEMLARDACGGSGRGLRLFLQGSKNKHTVNVGEVRFTTAQCANPGQFAEEPLGGSAHFDATDVNPAGSWAAGGIGSPTLELDDSSWQVLYDATPDPRQIDEFQALDFSIGRSTATVDPAWNPDVAPLAAPDAIPTSCQDRDCTDEPKYRDPFVREGIIAYTRDSGTGPEIVMEATYDHGRIRLDLSEAVLKAENTNWGEDGAIMCPDGVSQPSFASLPLNEQTEQYWLFFTCHSGSNTSVGYQRVTNETTTFELSEKGGTIEIVGKGSHAGGYALGGIESPEIIVERDKDSNVIYRLWFIARDRGQRRSIGLAQWQPESTEPPNFIPFPGNPVLETSDPEAACEAGCKLETLAVARDEDRLRFLLAQSVNVFGEVNYRIVSLVQNWSRPQ